MSFRTDWPVIYYVASVVALIGTQFCHDGVDRRRRSRLSSGRGRVRRRVPRRRLRRDRGRAGGGGQTHVVQRGHCFAVPPRIRSTDVVDARRPRVAMLIDVAVAVPVRTRTRLRAVVVVTVAVIVRNRVRSVRVRNERAARHTHPRSGAKPVIDPVVKFTPSAKTTGAIHALVAIRVIVREAVTVAVPARAPTRGEAVVCVAFGLPLVARRRRLRRRGRRRDGRRGFGRVLRRESVDDAHVVRRGHTVGSPDVVYTVIPEALVIFVTVALSVVALTRGGAEAAVPVGQASVAISRRVRRRDWVVQAATPGAHQPPRRLLWSRTSFKGRGGGWRQRPLLRLVPQEDHGKGERAQEEHELDLRGHVVQRHRPGDTGTETLLYLCLFHVFVVHHQSPTPL